MINAKKLQCLTTANWLIGYATMLDEHDDEQLIHKLQQAANLLADVWNEYEREQLSRKAKEECNDCI